MQNNESIWLIEADLKAGVLLQSRLCTHHFKVYRYTSGEDFLHEYDATQIGCVVTATRLPGISGFELQSRVKLLGGCHPFIYITSAASVKQAVSAIKSGAVNYLEKTENFDVLLDSIKQALALSREQAEQFRSAKTIYDNFSKLSPREHEVLELLVSGATNCTNKSIAEQLHISHRTVEHHRARIMKKTNAGSLPELLHMTNRYRVLNRVN